jgi:hypothetical protein
LAGAAGLAGFAGIDPLARAMGVKNKSAKISQRAACTNLFTAIPPRIPEKITLLYINYWMKIAIVLGVGQFALVRTGICLS